MFTSRSEFYSCRFKGCRQHGMFCARNSLTVHSTLRLNYVQPWRAWMSVPTHKHQIQQSHICFHSYYSKRERLMTFWVILHLHPWSILNRAPGLQTQIKSCNSEYSKLVLQMIESEKGQMVSNGRTEFHLLQEFSGGTEIQRCMHVSYITSLSVVMNWDKQGLNTLTEDQQTTAERFNKPKTW